MPFSTVEARFFQLSLDLLCIAGFDGRFQRMNPAWEAVLGYSSDLLEGRPFLDLVHPDDRDECAAVVGALMQGTGEVAGYQCRFLTASGESRHLRWTATADHANSLLLASARDVTDELRTAAERDRAVAERDEAAARRAALFDLSLDLLAVADLDGVLRETNQAWRTMLGHEPESLVGRPFDELLHPADVGSMRAAVRAALEDGRGVSRHEVRMRDAYGGYRWTAWSAAVDREAGRLVGVGRDSTTQRLVAEQQRTAAEAAEQASRAKSAFLANMSHELRTPLNSVIGFANILGKNRAGNLTDADLEFLTRIRDNGAHLLAIINEVLDLTKIEAGRTEVVLEPVDVADLVAEVLEQLAGAAQPGVALVGDVPAGLRSVVADPHRLRQVLINLVGNACKFTDAGSVTVRVRAAGDRPAAIDVVDTGAGIEAGDLPTIFEPFRQAEEGTSRSHGGTGLGLPIARSLCELMDFGLVVASEPGVGSTFTIDLDAAGEEAADRPVTDDPAPVRTPAAAHPVRTLPPGGLLALVVDDDADARMVVERNLQDLGVSVVATDRAAMAVDLARTVRPDLIVLDLVMPDLDGWTVLEQLRADPELSSVPVAVCSIVAADHRARLPAAAAILGKPFDPAELEALLAGLVGGEATEVLVVDDDADTRALLVELLRAQGVGARTAPDGRQALAALREGPRPDVVFLDLMMPHLDGFGVIRAMQSDPELAACPVVVMTAKDLSQAERADLAGAVQVVPKDERFAAAIEDAVQALLPPVPAV